MNSKISSFKNMFSKSIIKSDIRRYWWVFVIQSLILFLVVLNFTNSNRVYLSGSYIMSQFYNYMSVSFVFALIVPVILGAMQFSYLNGAKSISMFHSIPARRSTLYLSHIVSGFIIMLSSVALIVLVLLAYRFDNYIAGVAPIRYIFTWAGLYSLYLAAAYSLVIFSSMLCGNMAAAMVVTVGFSVAPVYLITFAANLLGSVVHGYANDSSYFLDALLSKIYIFPSDFCRAPYKILIYLIFAAVLYTVGYFLYRFRNLENHSEVMVFPRLRNVFVYVVGVFFGILGYYIFDSIYGSFVLFLIPLGIVGIIAAVMISRKTLNVKSALPHAVIYTAAVLIAAAVIHFDLTGFERRVPDLSDVESVYVKNHDRYHYQNNDTERVEITDEKKIAEVENLHRYLADDISDGSIDDYYNFYIEYTLKNGSKLKRSYSEYMPKNVVQPVLMMTEVKQNIYGVLNPIAENRRYVDITIEVADSGENIILNSDEFEGFISNLEQDIIDYDYRDDFKDRLGYVALKYVKNSDEENENVRYDNYRIYSGYERTFEFIEGKKEKRRLVE